MYWDKTAKVPSTLTLDPRVAAYLRPQSRVIDLGCGAGRLLGELSAAGFSTIGVDRNMPSLQLVRQRGDAVARADLAALPFAPATFDAGILHAVLTTLCPQERRVKVLTEARRIGCHVLCIADFLQNWDLSYYRARYEAGVDETGERGSFVVRDGDTVLYTAHHFTLEELTGLLAAAGFTVAFVDTPVVHTRSGKAITGVILAAVASES